MRRWLRWSSDLEPVVLRCAVWIGIEPLLVAMSFRSSRRMLICWPSRRVVCAVGVAPVDLAPRKSQRAQRRRGSRTDDRVRKDSLKTSRRAIRLSARGVLRRGILWSDPRRYCAKRTRTMFCLSTETSRENRRSRGEAAVNTRAAEIPSIVRPTRRCLVACCVVACILAAGCLRQLVAWGFDRGIASVIGVGVTDSIGLTTPEVL